MNCIWPEGKDQVFGLMLSAIGILNKTLRKEFKIPEDKIKRHKCFNFSTSINLKKRYVIDKKIKTKNRKKPIFLLKMSQKSKTVCKDDYLSTFE